MCVSILHRKSRTASLPGNPARWCQCGQRTECTLRSARVNHQTTATQEATLVNNASMTIWKATGFWCSLLGFWSQPQVKPIFDLDVFWLSLAAVKPPVVLQKPTVEWLMNGGKKGQKHSGCRRAPASPCDLSKHTDVLSHTHLYWHVAVLKQRRSSSSCHLGGGRLQKQSPLWWSSKLHN